MKIIWHAEGLKEVDWIREIFCDIVTEEIVDLDLTNTDDNSLHVVSSNVHPLAYYEPYFQQCRARSSRMFLLHLSDEWFSGSYRLYGYFDGVIRNFYTYLADGEGILTIPEGYSNGTRTGDRTKPIGERRYLWSFTGEVKASRVEMLKAFQGLEPSLLSRTASISDPNAKRLSKPEFDAILEDTAFSPCPMGNVILETWRLYESLELGCIPIVEKRGSLDYFRALFGANPIPCFTNWNEARAYAERAATDKEALLRKQQEIYGWWQAHKAAVKGSVEALLSGPSHRAALGEYARMTRNRIPLAHEALRLGELLRHQSAASIRRRLANPVGPVKRIWRESLKLGARSS